MQIIKNYWKRGLSIVLALILVFQIIQPEIIAQAINDEETIIEDVSAETEAYVIGEVEEFRDDSIKHYRMSDGSFVAMQYGTPVHYQDNSGEWQDIDNSLNLERENGDLVFVANAGNVTKRFASSFDGDYLFGVEYGSYSIDMSVADYEENYELLTGEQITISRSDSTSAVSENVNSQLVNAGQKSIVRVQASIDNPTERALFSSKETTLADISTPVNISSSVEYSDIYPDTSFVYSNNAYDVKESIIIDGRQEAYAYSFNLNLGNLTAEKNDIGDIILTNSQGDIVFSIPAPYMIDANGVDSQDVYYDLTQEAGGYVLTVTADEEWINDSSRAFPVILDPTLSVNAYMNTSNTSTLVGTYVTEGSPYQNHAGYQQMYVGLSSSDYPNFKEAQIFVGVGILPSIPYNCAVTSAQLRMYNNGFSYCGVSSIKIGAYEVTSSCPAETTYDNWIKYLTWSHRPTTGPEVLDYVTSSSSTKESFLSWDLTRTVVNWYKNSNSSRAVQLKLMDRTQYNGNTKYALSLILGYESATSGTQPVLCVTYRSTNGIEDYYTYQNASACNAGQVYISDFTNCMTIARPDVTLDLAPMSFTLTHYFNSSICGSYFSVNGNSNINTCNFTNMILGAGWKLSIQQTVVEKTIGGNLYLIYTDADGTEHYFYNSATNTFLDEDGLGLKIVKSTSSGNKIYTMTDTDVYTTWVFHNGYLISQTDHNGNAIYIAYNSNYSSSGTAWKPTSTGANRIVQIVQHTNNGSTVGINTVVANLGYDSNKFLTTITDYASRTTTFAYSNGCLTSITNPDGTIVTYTYAGNSTMLSAYDGDANYGVEFSYNWSTQSSGHGYRPVNVVAEYTMTDGVNSYGNRFQMKRNATLMSSVRYYGADGTAGTSDDLIVFNVFDFYGRTITSYTTDSDKKSILGVSAGAYKANSTTNTASNNRLSKTASSGQHVDNLLLNSSIEVNTESDGVLNWVKNCGDDVGSSNAIISGAFTFYTGRTPNRISPYMGSKQLKTYTGSYDKVAKLEQNISLDPGKYTFSAYTTTYCMRSFEGSASHNKGVYIAIYSSDGTEIARSNVVDYFTDATIENGWERLCAQFEINTTGTYTLAVCQDGAYGVAAFDNLQVEKSETMSSVNLLQDGSFELQSGNNYWGSRTLESAPADSSGSSLNHGNVVRLTGNPSNNVRVSQTVNINKSSDTTFLLSAWGKGASVNFAQKDEDTTYPKFFGLIASIKYVGDPETTVETQYVPFNPMSQEWQYASGVIVPKKTNKTVSTITVSLAYDKNANTAYFDNVSLIQEPVQTYSYDTKGNPIAATTDKAKSAYEYFSGTSKLKNYTTPSGNKYSYTYSGNNVASETLNGLTNYSYYNAAGEVTTSMTRVGTNGVFLQSTNVYDNNKNHRTSTTDVNGNTTYYAYSGTTHKLLRDTKTINGQAIAKQYQYNAQNGRTTKTYIDSIGSLVYGYSEGMMNSITHKSFPAVGSTANPFWQRYNIVYDGFGNMLKIRISGSDDDTNYTAELPLAEYTYAPNNGNLSCMSFGNGATVNYTYDIFDRKTSETYNDGANTVYNFKYDAEGNLANQSSTWNDNNDNTHSESYYYEYDSLGRLIHSKEYNDGGMVQRTEHLYDTSNRLTAQNWIFGDGSALGQTYTYSDGETGDGTITSIANSAKIGGSTINLPTTSYTYNTLRQLTRKTSGDFYRAYLYTPGAATNQTTSQVLFMNYKKSANDDLIAGYKYLYNDQGYISTICISIPPYTPIANYSYDLLGQLTSATDPTGTYSYSYDTAGNIRTATRNGTSHVYSYENDIWRDLLTSYGISGAEGTAEGTIIYEGQRYNDTGSIVGSPTSGNPISYFNGTRWNFTWQKGRQLATATSGTDDNTTSLSFTYDMAGVRSSKTVGSTTYNYTTLSGLVMRQTWDGKSIDFIYDDSNQPFAMIYKSGANADCEVYYYVLNLQGDVIGLMNGSGVLVAQYSYDPWGKVVSVSGSNENIANINPLRYRGYYYDSETGFYYVTSRYYDPEICRFINADTFATTDANGLLSTNMFAYCENNPIMRSDPTGEIFDTVLDAVSLASSIADVIANPSSVSCWLAVAADAVCLAVPGLSGGGIAVKALSKADTLLDTAKAVYKFADKSSDIRKATGSYEIVFNSGKTYVGKGGYKRMLTSAKAHGGDVKSLTWTKANSHRQAYINEYKSMCKFGGPNNNTIRNKNSLNKIWSPGRNYYFNDYGRYYSYGGR